MIPKPELLITAGTVEEAKRFIEAGADAVLIGEAAFGMRLPGDVTIQDLEELVPYVHDKGAKVYAAVNNVFDNEALLEVEKYLAAISAIGVDGAVYGDPAVLRMVNKAELKLPLHWNAEMTTTNYATANYWASRGAARAVLARELNLEETLEFKLHAKLEVQVQVHGLTNIYHSRRSLVANYVEHLGKDASSVDRSMDNGLFLIEQERQEERYPIYEDSNGTHVMSSDDICMLEDLHELLKGNIDSLKIEGLLKSAEYNETVVRAYRQVIDAYCADPDSYKFNDEMLEPIRRLQDPCRELSFGFFYKEQVY
ncbi:U32 family peptidase [Paenibacillus chitinolyticus]|uniref:U32 family peptidase n=1 Tax=Paenibacillus chitinolyticus TaxID=79263 RepID=A0A410X1U2_9BACL|nr:peptidase U32 family protein [Paenibacillus chitinolyticus]MCY9592672.1 U32 family peptidase [Paenibacillus chitinolyticus]MCY9594725.1 U32 family peptidase [Paenibacillus chitinolyticus]QAV20583.1 U32 family peptidase [Paenibacillus chitinolyticus]